MSKITENSTLRVEDFQEQRKWIGPILESYNSFIGQVIRVLNNGLIFSDNSIGLVHTFAFTFQTQAITFPQRIKWPYSALSPKHLTVTYAAEGSTATPMVTAWQFTDDRFVELTAVYKFTTTPALANLAAGTKYTLRVKVEP